MVVRIRHIDIARAVHRHAVGKIKPRGAARAIGAATAAGQTGQRGHHASGRDLADRVVVGVGHIDVARRVHRHAGGNIEPRGAAGAIGAAMLPGQSGQRGHHAGRRDLADRVVTGVRHIDVAGAVHRHANGIIKPRGAAGAIGAATAPPNRPACSPRQRA